MTYNTKGIFTQRRNSAGGFEEYPFNVTDNSVVVINSTGDLNCIANSDFIDSLPPVTSASYSLSSSYVPNLYPVNLNGYELTSSFNSYTSSNDNRVNNLTLNTSSYVNSSQTSSMLVGSSSIAFTASYITSSNISGIVNSSSYALTSSYLMGYSIPTLVTSSISSSYSNISHTSNTSSYLTLNNNNILVDDGLGNMVVTTTNNTIFTNTSQFGGNQVTQSSFFDNNGNLYITDPVLGTTTYIYTSGEIDCARGQASIDANGNFFGNHIFLTSKLPKGNGTIAIGDLDPNNGDWGIWTDASGTMDVYRQYNLYNPSNSGSRLQLDQNGNMWLKGTLTASFFYGSSSYALTASYVPNASVNLNGYVSTSSFNSYTSSNDSRVNSLISSTSSYLLSSQTSSMTVGTASYITSSNIVGNIISSSYSITSSYVPNLYPVNLNGYVSTSSFNNYTSSNNSVVNSLINATASYITISQTGSMSVLNSTSASYAATASYLIGYSSPTLVSSSISSSYSLTSSLAITASYLLGQSATSSYALTSSVSAGTTVSTTSNNTLYNFALVTGSSGVQPVYTNISLTYNPSTNTVGTTTISASTFTGSNSILSVITASNALMIGSKVGSTLITPTTYGGLNTVIGHSPTYDLPGTMPSWTFTDSASSQVLAALGFDNASNNSTAGQFSLAGKATYIDGNIAGIHINNLNLGGDNRMFVLRVKDPAAGLGDSGSYSLFENRYAPTALDKDTSYANWLVCNHFGNVGIGDLGANSDTAATVGSAFPGMLPPAKVTVYGSPNGNYPAFQVIAAGYNSSIGNFTVQANGQVSASAITSSLFLGTSSLASSLTGFNFNITQSYIVNNTQSNFVVLQYPTASVMSACFNYGVYSGSNYRAGQIISTWFNTASVYTDNSTNDIGNTLDVSMSVVVNGSNIQLLAAASSSLNWKINARGTYI